ncbi:DUF1015 domain-containing protein [Nonlabens sp. SCSIO 43208]|uniref:DUF1015 domain-containing protein n=1 Tax=Nonlabens sp. SCSIO 43208 TaxID=2793009 RepID=UPI003D6AA690
MPKIKPFKGVRASKEIATHLISRSYQDYKRKELKSTLKYNPFSFLHILNPGYKFNHESTGNERFQLVRNRYLEFKEDQFLKGESVPSFYLYQCTENGHEYVGIIAAASTYDYNNNVIKKHENTLKVRETLFKEYLKTVGFNAEPVLITYPDQQDIDDIVSRIKQREPEYHFKTTDRNEHKVWIIDDAKDCNKIEQSFAALPHLYIADGHHRSASSYLLSQDLGNKHDSYNYFMSFLIPESQLQIFEFNRLVTDLNDLTKENFLMKLDQHFRIQNRGKEMYKPSKKHHFSMYLDGEFYSLYWRKQVMTIDSPLDDLDTQMLYDYLLQPILDIKDPRNDRRLSYNYGKDALLDMKEQVDNNEYAVGFGLFPATVEQIKKIADADLVMPPKSTYIKPKLPSGLLIYEFENE